MRSIAPGLFQLAMTAVNVYFLVDETGIVVVDSGLPAHGGRILKAIKELGRSPSDVRMIIATHAHIDHTGSLAFLKRETQAPVVMHPADAELIKEGTTIRPWTPGRDLLSRVICKMSPTAARPRVDPVVADQLVEEGADIDIAGGISILHVPGHSAGQIALLWREKILIGADIATNIGRLRPPPLFEDEELAHRSIHRIAAIPFDTAVFGHGKALIGGASARFKEWADSLPR